jgi:hypothetical protein
MSFLRSRRIVNGHDEIDEYRTIFPRFFTGTPCMFFIDSTQLTRFFDKFCHVSSADVGIIFISNLLFKSRNGVLLLYIPFV